MFTPQGVTVSHRKLCSCTAWKRLMWSWTFTFVTLCVSLCNRLHYLSLTSSQSADIQLPLLWRYYFRSHCPLLCLWLVTSCPSSRHTKPWKSLAVDLFSRLGVRMCWKPFLKQHKARQALFRWVSSFIRRGLARFQCQFVHGCNTNLDSI